ncbi:MAG: sensor histidine kinase [Alphaproteobacteria bacterium]|nr:MAG: sensor histidine kinase [Alphaproteobacteria bacterium]
MSPLRLVRTWAFRVVALYALLFLISVAVLLGFIYVTTVGFIDRQINATIIAEINGLSDRYREQGLSGLTEAIAERISQDRVGDAIYLLTDSEYQPVAGNLPGWPTDVERQGRWATFMVTLSDDEDATGYDVRAMSFLLSEGYHLLVGRNLREREGFEQLIEESLVWSVLVTVLLGMFGGFVMSGDMRRRLDAINRTTGRIMQGDLHERVPLSGSGDEFDRLSANLNAMLVQIDRLMVGMREVSDNIAHDLRSPLNRLKSRLEVTLISHGSADQYRAALEQTVEETNQIIATFNALLSIAQAEAGSGRDHLAPLDFADLARDAAELYEAVAEARDQRLVAEVVGSAPVRGNRQLLFQALANLLDNATKYSPAGGSIRLTVAIDGPQVVCTVADSGPGIPLADRERVVQRFVRLERSRTTPGNGLGLSLVTAVMTLHGGQLSLGDAAPGLVATLALPLAREPQEISARSAA